MKRTKPRVIPGIVQSFIERCQHVWQLTQHKLHGAPKRFAKAASFFVLASVLVLASAVPVFAEQLPKPQDHQLESGVQDINSFLDRAPDKEVKDKREVKRELNNTLQRPWMFWWGIGHWKTCTTVKKLTKLLDRIEQIREQTQNEWLEELYTRLWMLRNDLLQSMSDSERRKCGDIANTGSDPRVDVKESDNTKVSVRTNFSTPTMTTVKGGGQTFTRMHVAGLENMVGQPGEPAIPMWRTLVALPHGSTPKIAMAKGLESDKLRLNLVPFQEQAVDQNPQLGDGETPPEPPAEVFADKPFKINERTYQTDRAFPENPCKVTPMGQYRDVQMAQLECTTAQYNPVTDEYILYRGMDVEVAFEGGEGNFLTSRTLSEFEPNTKLTTEAVLNKAALRGYVKDIDISILGCWGEEFLILTHPNFRAAADELATHKRAKGISTNVFEVGGTIASRDTAEEIDDFIEDRYDDCKVRPSYVMLLGDAEFIPTFYPTDMAENAGTDFPYSNYVQILFDAFFPDFGVGRVPVDTLGQANTVVDKIIQYESDPPNFGLGNGAPFYTTAGFASQFQCCRMNANGTPLNNQAGTDQRAFIETSEFVRNELLDRGYTVPRIYTRTVDNGGYCIQQNASGQCTQTQAAYSGDATPRRYFNGTLLPGGIGAGSGFAWSGSTADISSAWNAGRFLFLHRDHGWPGGWGSPGFSSTNVDALSNGENLPVVWSINCASGLFDNETANGIYDTTTGGVYFAERALRKADGGAVGIIGDTRNSPTWANNALTRGFFDAVWPDTLPSHGGNTSYKRLGDILNWGKIYLAGQVGVDQTAGSITIDQMGFQYNIWHVIGDPTLEMWTKNPRKLVLSPYFTLETYRLGEIIKYAQDGATITKLQRGDDGEIRAIGRAIVKDGVADMRYFQQPNPEEESFYSASLEDSVSVSLKPQETQPSDNPQDPR